MADLKPIPAEEINLFDRPVHDLFGQPIAGDRAFGYVGQGTERPYDRHEDNEQNGGVQ